MVKPYNSQGESEGLVRVIEPLVPFMVELLRPANGESDVSLRPTFSWETIYPYGPLADNSTVLYGNWIFEATAGDILVDVTENKEEFTLDFSLKPGTVYSWDIASAWAYSYDEDASGYSYALSFAGTDTGSVNGEFIFTTSLSEGGQ